MVTCFSRWHSCTDLMHTSQCCQNCLEKYYKNNKVLCVNNKCCLSAVPCAHTSNKASDESEDDLDEDGISEPSIKYPLRRMCTPIKLP